MGNEIIIFSHYGYTKYLEYTLACAKKSNPGARLILLGDNDNRVVAKKNGWEHHQLSNFKSVYHERFISVFRHIQGSKHVHLKNGRDWLRYVFERWFIIDGFVKENSINRFWHFDSDTMILDDLSKYTQQLGRYDFTVQCNGTCLNGFIKSSIVAEFCEHICDLFEDSVYISEQQSEFDNVNQGYAFTEMRAFDNYKKLTLHPWLHLVLYRDDIVFDDALSQSHGFQMTNLPTGERVKCIYSNSGSIYGTRDGLKVKFATLNMSWLPNYVYTWVYDALEEGNDVINTIKCSVFTYLIYRIKNVLRRYS